MRIADAPCARTPCAGVSRAEVIVVIVFLGVAGLVGWWLVDPSRPGSALHAAGSTADRANLRAIATALTAWSVTHDGNLPLPSTLDTRNHTVETPGTRKDTTANIMSLLVQHGLLVPETLVSPLERNPAITPISGYDYDRPDAAVDPDRALWDPSFRADFTTGTGHVSYAHLLPHAERVSVWHAEAPPGQPWLSARGPEVEAIDLVDPNRPLPIWTNPDSYTLDKPARSGGWRGPVASADTSVRFARSAAPTWLHHRFAARSRPDVLFADESDDPSHQNTFLSIFVDPGPDPQPGAGPSARPRPRAVWD